MVIKRRKILMPMIMSIYGLIPRSMALQISTPSKMMVLMSIARNGYTTSLKKIC